MLVRNNISIIRAYLIVLFFTLFMPLSGITHPHVFIDTQIKVHFDTKGISGFKITWTFDEMFSELMIDEFDKDFDEEFSKEEQKTIYKTAFSNLKKFGYFTEIYIDNKAFNINNITNFSAKIKDGMMIYSFFIPCHIMGSSTDRKVDIYTYDSSYYMDVSLSNHSISFTNSKAYIIDYHVVESQNKKYYYDQIYPLVLHLKFRKQ